MRTVNIIDVHHSLVTDLLASENQYGGITRTALRTTTTTVSLTNGDTLTQHLTYTYDASYDREAQRINMSKIKTDLNKLNTSQSSHI